MFSQGNMFWFVGDCRHSFCEPLIYCRFLGHYSVAAARTGVEYWRIAFWRASRPSTLPSATRTGCRASTPRWSAKLTRPAARPSATTRTTVASCFTASSAAVTVATRCWFWGDRRRPSRWRRVGATAPSRTTAPRSAPTSTGCAFRRHRRARRRQRTTTRRSTTSSARVRGQPWAVTWVSTTLGRATATGARGITRLTKTMGITQPGRRFSSLIQSARRRVGGRCRYLRRFRARCSWPCFVILWHSNEANLPLPRKSSEDCDTDGCWYVLPTAFETNWSIQTSKREKT